MYKLPEVGGAFGRYYGPIAFQVPSLVFLYFLVLEL